jgi:hypothetical protein
VARNQYGVFYYRYPDENEGTLFLRHRQTSVDIDRRRPERSRAADSDSAVLFSVAAWYPRRMRTSEIDPA